MCPFFPNSIPARRVIQDHAQRSDTCPINDPADEPKIVLARQGHPRTLSPPRFYRLVVGQMAPPEKNIKTVAETGFENEF
jgi:hypothetical protein